MVSQRQHKLLTLSRKVSIPQGLYSSMIFEKIIGFNMDNNVAKVATYGAHLVDGNLITNQLSIGRKTFRTGPDPPLPATAGGLNTHGPFEGDASMTRGSPKPAHR